MLQRGGMVELLIGGGGGASPVWRRLIASSQRMGALVCAVSMARCAGARVCGYRRRHDAANETQNIVGVVGVGKDGVSEVTWDGPYWWSVPDTYRRCVTTFVGFISFPIRCRYISELYPLRICIRYVSDKGHTAHHTYPCITGLNYAARIPIHVSVLEGYGHGNFLKKIRTRIRFTI
jgi:hypothetical protein